MNTAELRETIGMRLAAAGSASGGAIRALYDHYNARDFGRAAEQVAEDFHGAMVPFGALFTGREGYRTLLEGWAIAFPDSQVEVLRVIAGHDGGAVEFIGRGTHTGPLRTPAGEIPPSGSAIAVNFCDVYQTRDGKITELRSYFDSATLLRQIGVAAGPQSKVG